MNQLTPGQNMPLPGQVAAIEVTSPIAVDVSALLLGEDGKVRSDDDLVFYNAPSRAGVVYRPPSGGAPGVVEIDTAALPADVARVVVTASVDGAGTFGAGAPSAVLRNGPGGPEAAGFTPTGLGPETALLLVEVYRRNGAFKYRAVGQGWASGLAGLATDFGVQIDEGQDTSAAAPPAPAPQAAPPAAAPYSYTAPPPPAAPPAPAAAPAPAGPPRVTLDKGRVSLRKNESVSLVKGGRPALSRVRMGLGWDPAKAGRNIDLDASCIAFDASRRQQALVWFMKKSAFRDAIVHSGDNLTGAGEGDDEVITLDLTRIPPEITAVVFTVNSFSGQKFTDVSRAYCRLVDDLTGAEMVRFDLSDSKPQRGVLMCKLQREGEGWSMTALGEFADGRTVKKMVDPAAALL